MTRYFHVPVSEQRVRFLVLTLVASWLFAGSAAALSAEPASESAISAKATSEISPESATAGQHAKGNRVAPGKPAGGLAAGIKVRGWWTIDVRNPDGKLFSHTEFENSLVTNQPRQSIPGLVISGQSGDYAIAHLLTGALVFYRESTFGATTGPFSGSLADLTNALAAGGLNAPSDIYIFVPFLTIQEDTSTVPRSGATGWPTVINGFDFPLQVGALPVCIGGVCPDSTISTVNGNAISLTKTSLATQSGEISTIGTFLNMNEVVITPQNSPAIAAYQVPIFDGPLNAAHVVAAVAAITSVALSPLSGSNPPTCTAPPCVVPVQAGQAVSMSVTLSFN